MLSLLPAVLIMVVLVFGALAKRGRLAALPVLPPSTDPEPGEFALFTLAGVVVDGETRDAAHAYARNQGLEVVDLVPVDLPVAEAYALAREVDPGRYRADRLAVGRGAGHALLVATDLAARAEVTPSTDLDPAEIIRLTARLKKYAPTGMDVAVAPGLRAVPADPAAGKARMRAAGSIVAIALSGAVVGYVFLAAAVAFAPLWGLAALAVYSLQPYLVLAGTPLRPADRNRAWLRLISEPWRWLHTVRGTWQSRHDRARVRLREQARLEYAAELSNGTGHFFEPPRDDCPWCNGTELTVRTHTRDRVQSKPGRFTLVECDSCGHVFQNPRLSLDGLAFYYRDVYDRLGEDSTEHAFGLSIASYIGRADLVGLHTVPVNWLDVGTGHGHFCTYAQGVFPNTVFDGLDISDSIDDAQRRGWVSTGYRGLFPDFAEKLADSYDVVSMHHYLEHTRDPRAELDAAARVVAPGGHLLIEVPNPATRLARLLRGYWVPYFQPEHLNLVPVRNLTAALLQRGLQPVAVELGRAHQPCDFAGAVLLWVNSLFPDPDRPWAPRPGTRARRLTRQAAFVAAVPLLVAGNILDQLLGAVIARTEGGNCYRVLAQKPQVTP
ncbi:MAG TPA: class I SAM-dependent methyltransferase [Actinoplanes sp.]|nr:class I SAM-dependent methyltransferase [Actinoplanes sp.]